ncbi:flagellar biosynthesis protein FliQ [Clostridium fallax]|uniref:Flagellar biosynthetic protein FliQ n=1 Tax=Clostridium fallax TaxID=1533 RepID=A0A1M4UJJ1_9CLOT|nr:flagellar biosynthesis protein FliQ [Clostridium fallax]SHE56723.1 flagellar biosynthetic protein FliQ [Clostridium fallax]SQB07592.1 flagellar biosynthesis protein FliQ [Clostridium fallax]
MSEHLVIGIIKDTMATALKLSAPFLTVAIVVGLIISIIQATTQIQEQTLTFVPKLIGIAVVGLLLCSWITHNMIGFTERIFTLISNIVH